MCSYFGIASSGFILFPQSQSNITWMLEETVVWTGLLRFLADSKNRALLSIKIRLKRQWHWARLIALVFCSAKKCPSCLAGTLCLSGLSDLGERLQTINCHLPPCPSSYPPQGEGPSEDTTFRSNCDKACVPWKTNLILLHLVLCWFHVADPPLCSLFSFSLQGSRYLDSCWISPSPSYPAPALGSAGGRKAACAGERSASPMDQHLRAMCCANPWPLGMLAARLELP